MNNEFEELRRKMVEDQLIARGITDELIIKAFLRVPRHLFVPPSLQKEAYNDYPLPIGGGQTISQPYMVAIMLEEADLSPEHRVLEVGTGSGYQTALLAEIVREVYSIERIQELAVKAEKILNQLGYKNVKIKVGDGTLGWEEYAPFDRIIVTAGAPKVPDSLKKQLSRNGGKMVIPVGSRHMQALTVVTRKGEDLFVEKSAPCVFVPLLGKEGWRE